MTKLPWGSSQVRKGWWPLTYILVASNQLRKYKTKLHLVLTRGSLCSLTTDLQGDPWANSVGAPKNPTAEVEAAVRFLHLQQQQQQWLIQLHPGPVSDRWVSLHCVSSRQIALSDGEQEQHCVVAHHEPRGFPAARQVARQGHVLSHSGSHHGALEEATGGGQERQVEGSSTCSRWAQVSWTWERRILKSGGIMLPNTVSGSIRLVFWIEPSIWFVLNTFVGSGQLWLK